MLLTENESRKLDDKEDQENSESSLTNLNKKGWTNPPFYLRFKLTLLNGDGSFQFLFLVFGYFNSQDAVFVASIYFICLHTVGQVK